MERGVEGGRERGGWKGHTFRPPEYIKAESCELKMLSWEGEGEEDLLSVFVLDTNLQKEVKRSEQTPRVWRFSSPHLLVPVKASGDLKGNRICDLLFSSAASCKF